MVPHCYPFLPGLEEEVEGMEEMGEDQDQPLPEQDEPMEEGDDKNVRHAQSMHTG